MKSGTSQTPITVERQTVMARDYDLGGDLCRNGFAVGEHLILLCDPTNHRYDACKRGAPIDIKSLPRQPRGREPNSPMLQSDNKEPNAPIWQQTWGGEWPCHRKLCQRDPTLNRDLAESLERFHQEFLMS